MRNRLRKNGTAAPDNNTRTAPSHGSVKLLIATSATVARLNRVNYLQKEVSALNYYIHEDKYLESTSSDHFFCHIWVKTDCLIRKCTYLPNR
jgi:hypothetical protein